MIMKPVNESSSKPTEQDIEMSVEGIAAIQALITQGIESGAPTIFDKGVFWARMTQQHDRARNYNNELVERALL
jgi:hypothetical protein